MKKTIRKRSLGSVSCLALVVAGLTMTAAQARAGDAGNPDNPDIEIVVVTAARGTRGRYRADEILARCDGAAVHHDAHLHRGLGRRCLGLHRHRAWCRRAFPAAIDNNGPGLSEKDAVIRGFKDGLYNVRYDDIPFGDTNDPTHHSTSYFPSSTVGAMQIDRGPGEAGDLGQASLGGSMNLYSRTLTDDFYLQQKITYGSWNTRNFVTTIQSGKLADLNDTRITANFQELQSDGALSYSKVKQYNQFLKFETPLGANWTLTFLATHNSGQFHQPDKDGITMGQAQAFGKNYLDDRTTRPSPTY